MIYIYNSFYICVYLIIFNYLFQAINEENIRDVKNILTTQEINKQKFYGQPALHYACCKRNKDILRLILEAGADVRIS